MSIQAQEGRIRQWADLSGAVLTEVVEDLGVSGTKPLDQRPGGTPRHRECARLNRRIACRQRRHGHISLRRFPRTPSARISTSLSAGNIHHDNSEEIHDEPNTFDYFAEYAALDAQLPVTRGDLVDVLITIEHPEGGFTVVARAVVLWPSRRRGWHVDCDYVDLGTGNLGLIEPLARLTAASIGDGIAMSVLPAGIRL